MKKHETRLSAFVRKECANHDSYYGGCLFATECSVLTSRPCRYFERSVLGPPDYPYKTAGYDWGKLFAEYGTINSRFSGRGVTVRRCECGAVLGVRKKVCDTCRKTRRRATYRDSQRKRRRDRLGVNS